MHMERRQSIKAVARSTAIGGTFQASVRPVDVLAMGDMRTAFCGQMAERIITRD